MAPSYETNFTTDLLFCCTGCFYGVITIKQMVYNKAGGHRAHLQLRCDWKWKKSHMIRSEMWDVRSGKNVPRIRLSDPFPFRRLEKILPLWDHEEKTQKINHHDDLKKRDCVYTGHISARPFSVFNFWTKLFSNFILLTSSCFTRIENDLTQNLCLSFIL